MGDKGSRCERESRSSELTHSRGILEFDPGSRGRWDDIGCAASGEEVPDASVDSSVNCRRITGLKPEETQGFATRIVAESGKNMLATLSRTCAR